MENKNILIKLQKKKNDELKKMGELDELSFNKNMSFDTAVELRKKYKNHLNKYNFYKNMIENMKKGDANDK